MTVTAYNVGVVSQNDSEPCIGAYGIDLCKELAKSPKCIVGANWAPRGTIVHLNGWGDCTIMDKMNRRYPQRVDIAFPANQIKEALKFGKQQILVSYSI